jgi:hypothetical protein
LVHLTHDLPNAAQQTTDPDAAYILVTPGNHPKLCIQSKSTNGLRMAIDSISNLDNFPFALESALHGHANSLIRISQKSGGQLTAAVDNELWPH